MRVCVFLGPTLPRAEAAQLLDATYLPPAAEGDVYRAALQRPQVIGIVDGYFHSRAAIRHKEILWAMKEGIHVFGAASMGALRAAELAAFGMEGVGEVFAQYRDGTLEDDDEVAIVHGREEAHFMAASDAMVNIRATLAKAEKAKVISSASRVALEKAAKERFFPHRSYRMLLAGASELSLPTAEIAAFAAWLPTGAVDQKRADARSMLSEIGRRIQDGLSPKSVVYHFENTEMWVTSTARWTESAAGAGTPLS